MEKNQTTNFVKNCPHCQKEINGNAKKCPYCQSDLRPWPRRHPILTGILIIIGIIILSSMFDASSPNQTSNTNTSNTATQYNSNTSIDDFSLIISEKTGENSSDIKNAMLVVQRYNLDNELSEIVVDNAAMIASMDSNGQDSSQLQFLGFGNLMQTSDILAQIANAWKFDDATAQHNFDLLYNFATKSTLKWPQFSTALIENGPKFYGYTTFADAAGTLYGMSTIFPADSTVSIFGRVGDATIDPNDKMNIALGGSGYIGEIVKKDGVLKAVEAISDYIKQNIN